MKSMRPRLLEFSMKSVMAVVIAVILSVAAAANVSAQTSESIWLSANTTAYKNGETVTVTLNAASATPIQGFTFQIRYDPACLQPVNAVSPITGMNGLALPQTSGLVDGTFASTTPQTVNGTLAEVRFTALAGCQTSLMLESAALAIRNESGFAAPLAGTTLGEKNIPLNIDREMGVPQPTEPVSGSTLPLTPTQSSERNFSGWLILAVILLIVGMLFGVFKLIRMKPVTNLKTPASSPAPILQIKHGPYAGKSFVLNRLPCHIGRDPVNEICLRDPHIISRHATIFSENNGYYLMDLGGLTFVNGRAVRQSSAALKPGDVVRLGRSVYFVFGL
jgi:hypothetical protein